MIHVETDPISPLSREPRVALLHRKGLGTTGRRWCGISVKCEVARPYSHAGVVPRLSRSPQGSPRDIITRGVGSTPRSRAAISRHAAVGWARRMKINLDTECGSAENERFCYALSTMLECTNAAASSRCGEANLRVICGRAPSSAGSARRHRASGPRPGAGDDRPGPA